MTVHDPERNPYRTLRVAEPDRGLPPNGDQKAGSPSASMLIYGDQDAVLTEPGFTAAQARALGDWVAGKDPEPD